MAWEQLSINRPHLVYIILGGFTSIFMLVSLFIKEKLYIGEATVATICGVIFGPHAANLINPLDWGNTDQITLEFSRIVLVVQCFAVGVELPKAYMERHWKSVVFLLVPVMAFGWLITSLFIWWLIEPLTWLESLAVAACVTATDPVLASSVVGKGKFAKRVPKHLRDILSAESGCNDGMAFPFIYLALYLLRYHLDAAHVTFHWFCFTILYECVFGAFYGFMVGYIARHAIKLAERKGIIDRESFLVFYFVLALFCAGSGSMLGMDDLLIGFAAGVGFSNDGWFTEKTEESHVSNVIDLLLNLSYFVYFGTIIPWDQFNAPDHGLEPWRLVCIAILVLFFRRLPIMMALKPIIPDIKTWREALFAGHFGPIGVGAVFVAILARAELETDSTTPLAELPPPDDPEYTLIYTIWPIVTFLIIASIIVHGSSIAVFTLGKRINTLTLTYSYTTGNEKSSAWMNRLPRISSQGRSMSKMSDEEMSIDKEFPAGFKLALRRQRDEEYEKPGSRSSSLRPLRRRKRKDYGGPISQSAIIPARRDELALGKEESGASTPIGRPTPIDDLRVSEKLDSGEGSSGSSPMPEQNQERSRRRRSRSPSDARAVDVEAYEEGGHLVIEDEEGNVLETVETSGKTDEDKAAIIDEARRKLARDQSGNYAKHKHESHAKDEGEEIEQTVEQAAENPQKGFKKAFENWTGFGKKSQAASAGQAPPERRRGPAHAYQFGNTIIVEDEDGEVIKKYTIPGSENQQRRFTYGNDQVRSGLQRMGTWVGLSHKPDKVAAEASGVPAEKLREVNEDDFNESAAEARPDTPGKRPEKVDKPEKPEKPEKPKRRNTNAVDENGEDDGLRLTVSKADYYGLTGLQKRKAQEGKEDGPDVIGNGRRMTTRDLFESLQQMDAKSKARAAEILEASDAKQSDNEGVRPSARSYASNVVREPRVEEEPDDYFSPRRPSRISRSETDRPKSSGRPQTHRQDTYESVQSIDVPTHDALSTIARVGNGTTAADLRRQRLSTQYESGSGDRKDATGNEEERETAAERRRRLAALGMGGGNESDSDVSDTDAPRRPREAAIREPGESPPPARRIQWGGESGRERAKTVDEENKPQTKSDDVPSGSSAGGGVGKKFRGFLKR